MCVCVFVWGRVVKSKKFIYRRTNKKQTIGLDFGKNEMKFERHKTQITTKFCYTIVQFISASGDVIDRSGDTYVIGLPTFSLIFT